MGEGCQSFKHGHDMTLDEKVRNFTDSPLGGNIKRGGRSAYMFVLKSPKMYTAFFRPKVTPGLVFTMYTHFLAQVMLNNGILHGPFYI